MLMSDINITPTSSKSFDFWFWKEYNGIYGDDYYSKKIGEGIKICFSKIRSFKRRSFIKCNFVLPSDFREKDTIEGGIGGVGENERFWFIEIWEKDMKKGDVCIINLAVGIGHEQYGQRPAILISDTKIGIGIVIPLTSNLEALRFPFTLAILPDKQNNLKQKSVALIFHIRAIDKTRVSKVIGKINAQTQKKIDSILKEMLEL